MLTIFFYVFSAITIAGLGLFVFAANQKHTANRLLTYFSLSSTIWILANLFATIATTDQAALFWSRLAIVPGASMAAAFFLLSRSFDTERKITKKIALWIFIPFGIITLLSPTDLNAKSITAGQNNLVIGPLYGLLIAYIIFCLFGGLLILYKIYRSSRGVTHQQVLYVFVGIALAFIPITFTNAIALVFGINSLLDVGPSFVLIFVLLSAIAIIRHRLFNIRAIVARSVAYIFSVLSFAMIYGFLAFGVIQNLLLSNILTTRSSQQIFNIILAVILAFTFPSIRRFFEKITDRIFYRDRYDPQLLVSEIGRVLASEIRLDPLSNKVAQILETDMRITDTNIVVLGHKETEDEAEKKARAGIYYQTHSDKLHQAYHIDDLASIRLPVVITDELASGDEREMLERHHIRAAFTLKTRESFVGYLLLGDKRSGDIYSNQDIQTLRIISNELAVAIQNARSYTEIQRFNTTLREKIKQATADLTHANHELKALDKAKDEFISMASHQLRTPLTAVRGYTSMVMEGDFGHVSAEQRDTLKQSFDAATRMTRLVDDLLNVSRIQSGRFRIERAEVDLNGVLPQELSLLETTASTKQVKITYHTPKKPVPNILIDEGKTRQCLMNLMDNAIYYSSTAKGGGQVQVYLESDAHNVIFRVTDNGIGVPKALQAKLFKKFYRAPNAQKARPDGTGLGLFLVGKVVRDQHGEIIFESEEGKGSTFGFKLPIKAAGEGLEGVSEAVVGAKP